MLMRWGLFSDWKRLYHIYSYDFKENIIFDTIFQLKYQKQPNNPPDSIIYNTNKAVKRMFEEDFSRRLSQLRERKGVSARDMSLSIGQNAGYINSIENGKALPSMSAFLSLCDYLGITPREFFDLESNAPDKLRLLVENLKQLNDEQFHSVEIIVRDLAKRN